MKKLFIILSAATASLIMGCDNDSTVNPAPTGTAKITGNVYADFNLANNTPTQTWDAIVSRKLIVGVYDNVSESVRYFDATTDANGAYSIEIPVGNHELEVAIWSVDFKQTVTNGDNTTTEVLFYGDSFYTDLDVVKGGEYIRDIYYND